MLIVAINAGSSSLRLSLFAETDGGVVLQTKVLHQNIDEADKHLLLDFLAAVDVSDIKLVAHRVVHGGSLLTTPCLIDAVVEEKIEALSSLAPLHNPVALAWIRMARGLLGQQIPQIAIFDTAFYQSLPAVARTYALPQALCCQYNIRRYGFHGLAHSAMLKRWQGIRPQMDGGRVISVQLGSGCSITAIKQGKPVDTSMGFSPLEGLVMATRAGDLDPAIILYLQRETGMRVEEVERLLSHQSGLLGVSGKSGDMRVLLKSNSVAAGLAVDLYCYRVRKYIGAYLAVLEGADAILFGGGVGENSSQVRAKILKDMCWSGIDLDVARNENTVGTEARISSDQSKVDVRVITVDEAGMMAQIALEVVRKTRK